MNDKSIVNFRLLVGTALVSGMLFSNATQAGSLRKAPDLPSIEVNFSAIEKLKAETKQLEKMKKIEAQKAAKAKAADEKKQLAEKKKGKTSESAKVAKAEKKATKKKKDLAGKAPKKQDTKVAKSNKKKEIKIARPKVSAEPEFIEKKPEQPKLIAEKTETQKITLADVGQREPVVNTVVKNETKEEIVLKSPEAKAQQLKEPPVIKSESDDLLKVEKKPEVKDLPPSLPVNKNIPPVVANVAESDNSPSFFSKISDFFAARPVEPVPAPATIAMAHKEPLIDKKKAEPLPAPQKHAEKQPDLVLPTHHEEVEDEEEIAAREYAKHEADMEKFNENISSENGPAEAIDESQQDSKNIILPNKIEPDNAPPIPNLAELVELKREAPQLAPAAKDVKPLSDDEWKAALDDAKKKASASPAEETQVGKAEIAEIKQVEAPKQVVQKPVVDLKPEKPEEKVSIISSVLDWMPSFSGNKTQTGDNLQTAVSPVVKSEKPVPVTADKLSVKTSDNEVLSQKPVDAAPEVVKAEVPAGEVPVVAEEQKTIPVEVVSDKSELPELAPMPQIETVALPTSLNQKMEALKISFNGNGLELSEADKNRLADFVKKIIESKDKIKIVSTSPSIDNDINSARRISLKRAIAIRAQMIEYGLDSARINVQAIGNQDSSSLNGVNILVFENSAS